LHKWRNYGEEKILTWEEPGFVPGTRQKIQKLRHTERECSRCGTKQKRIYIENLDGTKAPGGWEAIEQKKE
jgi:hypothetical protein